MLNPKQIRTSPLRNNQDSGAPAPSRSLPVFLFGSVSLPLRSLFSAAPVPLKTPPAPPMKQRRRLRLIWFPPPHLSFTSSAEAAASAALFPPRRPVSAQHTQKPNFFSNRPAGFAVLYGLGCSGRGGGVLRAVRRLPVHNRANPETSFPTTRPSNKNPETNSLLAPSNARYQQLQSSNPLPNQQPIGCLIQ